MMTTICNIKLEKTILGGILHLLYCGPFTPLMSTAPVIPAQQKNPFSMACSCLLLSNQFAKLGAHKQLASYILV